MKLGMKAAGAAGFSLRSGSVGTFSFLAGLLAAALLVSGCGDFWQAPATTTTTGTCTTDCSTSTSGAFFILNSGDTPQVVGESIVSGTTIQATTGSPWTVQGTPYSMAVDPNGGFLIVSSTSGIFSYPITSGQLGTAVVLSSDQAYAYGVQVDSTSSWVIEAIPGTGGVTIGAVPVDSATGAATGAAQSVSFNIANATLQTNRLVISGDNANLFVSLGAGGTLVVPFNAAVATGGNPLSTKGTTIPVAATSGQALSVAVDAGITPRLFYVGETLASGGTTGGLRVFNYSSLGSTALTQATGSPIASGGLAPNYILPASGGDYVYVANGTGASSAGNITGFTVTASTAATPVYTIAAGSSTAAGVQPLAMAEDSTDAFIVEVGSLGSPYLDAYAFDATTLGQLDSQVASTTSAGSIAIVAVP
jgi:hypothetical protein